MTEHADRRTEHDRPESDAGSSSEDDLAEASYQDLIDEVRALRTRVDESEAQSNECHNRIEALEQRMDEQAAALEQKDERIDELEQRVEKEEERAEHLEDVARTAVGAAQAAKSKLQEVREHARAAMAFGNDLADRLSNLEEEDHVDAAEQTVATPAGVDPASSPLDFFANVRSGNLDDNLSKNQVRAIRIAKRWDEFAKTSHHDGSVAWDREAITDALTAELGEKPFRETVSRVWDKLTSLGSDDVRETRRNNGQTTGTGTKVLRMDRAVAEGLQDARYVQFDLLDEARANGGGGVMPVVTG